MVTNLELTEIEKMSIFEVVYPKIVAECKKRNATPVRLGLTWFEYITRYGDWVVVWYGYEKNGVVDIALIQAKFDDLNVALRNLAKESETYELPQLQKN